MTRPESNLIEYKSNKRSNTTALSKTSLAVPLISLNYDKLTDWRRFRADELSCE